VDTLGPPERVWCSYGASANRAVGRGGGGTGTGTGPEGLLASRSRAALPHEFNLTKKAGQIAVGSVRWATEFPVTWKIVQSGVKRFSFFFFFYDWG
jgi:hypothetical protein